MSNRTRAAFSIQKQLRINRIKRPHSPPVADKAETGDTTASMAKRVASRLPSTMIDTSPVFAKGQEVPWRSLPFVHFEGDRQDKGYWVERGAPTLFDQCQGSGHGAKGNLWYVPEGTSKADGRILAREAERDELDLMVLAWRESKGMHI